MDSAFNIKTTVLQAYDDYAGMIYRHCIFRVFDADVAEDYTQETFLRLHEYLYAGHEVDHMKSFLYRTANNLIIDNVRKKHDMSLDTLMHTGYNPEGSSEETLMNGVDARLVFDVMRQIEEEYRTPVLMRYVENLKPREIAEILDTSQNIVSVRIHRGIKKVQAIVEKR